MKKSEEDYLVASIKQTLWRLGIFIAMLIVFALTSCKTAEYVPVEVHDTIHHEVVRHDSIYKHDSIIVNTYMKGDTVYRDRDHWHTEYVEKIKKDTAYISKEKPVPYPVEKKVERELTWWQKTQMYGFRVVLIVALLLLIWKKWKIVVNVIKRIMCTVGF